MPSSFQNLPKDYDCHTEPLGEIFQDMESQRGVILSESEKSHKPKESQNTTPTSTISFSQRQSPYTQVVELVERLRGLRGDKKS